MVLLTEQIVKGKTRLDKLEDVKNLNLWGQELDDVSVLSKLPNVEVLSLSVNKISSLRHFASCTKLQELYLRRNEISDLNEIGHLQGLRDLRVLWLCDNPVASHPAYLGTVARMLPQLSKLDNEDLATGLPDPSIRGPPPPPSAPSQQAMAPPPGMYERMPSVGGARGSPARGPSAAAGLDGPLNLTAVMHDPSPASRPQRSSKNVLYAVMALLGELDEDDLIYVRREVEQRLASGR